VETMTHNRGAGDEAKVKKSFLGSNGSDYVFALLLIVLALTFAYGSSINDAAVSLAALSDCVSQTTSHLRSDCTPERLATHAVRVKSAYLVGKSVIGALALLSLLFALLYLWIGRTRLMFRIAVLAIVVTALVYQLSVTV
jgi:hypothetical protein